MSSPNCAAVRSYLSGLAAGSGPSSPPPGVWEALASHGAVSGSAAAPTLTPVGRHVLAELEVRAYRTDGQPLEKVAADLARILEEYDTVAKTAEYFLAELGPVVPPLALPLLRPVAVGLANRRETPEELAEEFRNVWGGVEVMGGDPRDRLLAAELMNASSADMEHLYSPIMNTTERIREKVGSARSSVTPATILQVNSGDTTPVPLDAFLSVRSTAGSEEAAAVLASVGADPPGAVRERDALARSLVNGAAPTGDALHAATFLVAEKLGEASSDRVRAMAALLQNRLGSPLTAAALITAHNDLTPAELLNWFEKAVAVVSGRNLAPTDRELAALAVGIVHGLPAAEYVQPSAAGSRPPPGPLTLAALTSLHAWIYRPLVGAAEPLPAASA